MPVDLTISLINHSNPDLLRECLRSIKVTTHVISFDIWVVDNATDQELVPDIQAEFPDVQWIFNTQRLGFAANNNQVLCASTGRYACILNDDTIIHDGAFDIMVAYMDSHQEVGMIGPKMLNPDGTLQHTVHRFPTLWSEFLVYVLMPKPLEAMFSLGEYAPQFVQMPTQVDWFWGACIVIRKEAMQQIGLLDEKNSPTVFAEDLDWCFRNRKAGWQTVYAPQAVITHYQGQSTVADTSWRWRCKEVFKTSWRFHRKHRGRVRACLLLLGITVMYPWNALVLTQRVLRRRIPYEQYQKSLLKGLFVVGMNLTLPWES